MEELCATFSGKLVENGVIEKENEDIYAYGLEVMLSTVFDVLLTLAIGLIFNKLSEVAIYFVTLVCIRKFTGGYHAKTYLGCKTVFAATIFVVLYTSNFLESAITPLIIVFGFSVVLTIVVMLSPVPNVYKTLSEQQRKNSRTFAILLSCSILK